MRCCAVQCDFKKVTSHLEEDGSWTVILFDETLLPNSFLVLAENYIMGSKSLLIFAESETQGIEAIHLLGVLATKTSNLREAEAWLEVAVAEGHSDSAFEYACALHLRRDLARMVCIELSLISFKHLIARLVTRTPV